MNIFDRILQFIDFKGLSKNEFSKIMGLSNSYMTKMGVNKGNIGSQIIEKIVRIYPEINLSWLITGDGEMLVSENKNNQESMDCKKCGIKNDLTRYQRDLERYQKEIEYLNKQLNDLRTTGTPESKLKNAS